MSAGLLNYLQLCHSQFPAISEKLYRSPFDLHAIERAVRHLRQRDFLTYGDLNYFIWPEHWWFDLFWAFPPKERLKGTLREVTFDFRNLPENEATVVRNLLQVFKSIEIASIILRFVWPEHYGIISPPVERVLDVRRGGDAAQIYLHYLVNLRTIQRHYRFKRAADADMALWVLHEKCYGRYREAKIKASYEADSFMLQLRASNLVGPIAKLPLPRLAQALDGESAALASLVACYSFELQVRAFAQRHGLPDTGKLSDLIDRLFLDRQITSEKKKHWLRLKRVRDVFFHDGEAPTDRDRSDLISEIIRLDEALRTSH